MVEASVIADNVRRFREELDRELARLGRPVDSVTIVAVSKTFPAKTVIEAAGCGMTQFGENRVQEAAEKIPQVTTASPIAWHLIGHLQSNKAKDAVALFHVIQSVDSWHLADEINRRAAASGKRQDVLIQVNTSGEEQKSGCMPWDVDELVADAVAMKNLRLMGVMTIGPLTEDEDDIAAAFHDLRAIFDRLKESDLQGGAMRHCSMGMTDDWKIALAEGSNMLRIGRAIFGERTK